VIGLANAGGDTINAIKQAAEFGITKGGQKVSPLLGLRHRYRQRSGSETAQGLLLARPSTGTSTTTPRVLKRFMERIKRPADSAQAGVYSSVTHYLKAVKAAGTTDSARSSR
jgi:branched-chain amino acid transport system substrate-binding protein